MAGIMAQFGHDSLLNSGSMMPPNIPGLPHDLSNATADEMLEAAMAGNIGMIFHTVNSHLLILL